MDSWTDVKKQGLTPWILFQIGSALGLQGQGTEERDAISCRSLDPVNWRPYLTDYDVDICRRVYRNHGRIAELLDVAVAYRRGRSLENRDHPRVTEVRREIQDLLRHLVD